MRHLICLLICMLPAVTLADQGPTEPSFHANQAGVEPYPNSPGPMMPAAILEDTTHFNYERFEPDDEPFAFDAARISTRLFTATGRGLQSFDISNPEAPSSGTYVHGPDLFAQWWHSDKDFFIKSVSGVDRPEGSDLLVVGAEEQGLVVLAVDGHQLQLRFQEPGTSIIPRQVYATTLNGRPWAFAADKSMGLYAYDIAACAGAPCVPEKIVLSYTGAFWVAGAGDYLVSRPGIDTVEVRHIADPWTPSLRITGKTPGFANQAVMWESDDALFLAVLGNSELWVWDVSCAKESDGCDLPANYSVYPVPDDSLSGLPSRQTFLSISQDGGDTYLYVGNLNTGDTCVDQREYLFWADDKDGKRLVEVTPAAAYWGWYYESCRPLNNGNPQADPPGFNNTIPMRGLVYNNYFYRAAFSFLDSHCLTCGPEPEPEPEPEPAEVFADGFESGDVSGWSGNATGPGVSE